MAQFAKQIQLPAKSFAPVWIESPFKWYTSFKRFDQSGLNWLSFKDRPGMMPKERMNP
jgi:hypothetical protein